MRSYNIPDAPVLQPCSTEDCFLSRDGVMADKGNAFATMNFISKLVMAKGGDQLESFCGAMEDINTIACSETAATAICPRLALAHTTLSAAGGVEQLREYMASHASKPPTVPMSIADLPPTQN